MTPQVLLTLQLWKSQTAGLQSHALAAPDLGQAVPTFLHYPQALATLFPKGTQATKRAESYPLLAGFASLETKPNKLTRKTEAQPESGMMPLLCQQ